MKYFAVLASANACPKQTDVKTKLQRMSGSTPLQESFESSIPPSSKGNL